MACRTCRARRAKLKCSMWSILDHRHDRVFAFAKNLGPGFYVKPNTLDVYLTNSAEPNKPFLIFSDKVD